MCRVSVSTVCRNSRVYFAWATKCEYSVPLIAAMSSPPRKSDAHIPLEFAQQRVQAPEEADVGKRALLDSVDSLGRRIYDSYRGIMAYLIMRINFRPILRKYALAKAKTSPEGENATPWTQPPLALAYSPQMVLKGNFSPQTVGWGLCGSSQNLGEI